MELSFQVRETDTNKHADPKALMNLADPIGQMAAGGGRCLVPHMVRV